MARRTVFASRLLLVALLAREKTCGAGMARRDISKQLVVQRSESTALNQYSAPVVNGAGYLTADTQFLHFPKCGTSFKRILLACLDTCTHLLRVSNHTAIACGHIGMRALQRLNFHTERDDDECCHALADSHQPLVHLHSNRLIAAMFRDPFGRLVSAFHHALHAMARHPASYDVYLRRGVLDAIMRNLSADARLATYASLGAIQHCYVKMLTGRWCADHVLVSPADVLTAKANTLMLDFVGLTHEWGASVCLLHAQFSLREPDWAFESANVRPGNYASDQRWVSAGTREIVALAVKHDREVYDVAAGAFNARMEQHRQCERWLLKKLPPTR